MADETSTVWTSDEKGSVIHMRFTAGRLADVVKSGGYDGRALHKTLDFKDKCFICILNYEKHYNMLALMMTTAMQLVQHHI